MNYLHFKSFVITAEHKTITSAAKSLYITPVSLMQQLNLFEEELGFKVFSRSRRGVMLTNAGKLLYERGKVLFDGIDSLILDCRAVAQQDENTILISLARPYFIMKLADMYTKEFPNIHLEFDRIDPLTCENLKSHLTKDDFDMIQSIFDPSIIDPVYDVVYFPTDRLHCVMLPDHPLSKHTSITLDDLNGTTVDTYSNYPHPIDKLEERIRNEQRDIPIRRTLYNERSLIKACSNHGVYIFLGQASKTFDFLRTIPIEPPIPAELGLAYRRDAKPTVQHFAQYVRDHMDVIAAQYE